MECCNHSYLFHFKSFVNSVLEYLTMKFSLWTDYGAMNSKPVFKAFEKSLRDAGCTVVFNDMDADVAVIWSVLWNGRMAQNKKVWDTFQSLGKSVIVLEVGGIKRGETWKVALNGINGEAYFGPMGQDGSRAEKLGLKLTPWQRNDDGDIIICCQHPKSHQWRMQPSVSRWVEQVVDTIRSQTARRIVIRPHPRFRLDSIEHEWQNVVKQMPQHINGSYDDFDFAPSNAWAVISWSSNPGPQSAIQGIPVFTGPESLAYLVANKDLKDIEDPKYYEREDWMNNYAWTEFTLDEIEKGLPFNRLTSKL